MPTHDEGVIWSVILKNPDDLFTTLKASFYAIDQSIVAIVPQRAVDSKYLPTKLFKSFFQ